jgi:outer membrane receptor protein involved in Fe transport
VLLSSGATTRGFHALLAGALIATLPANGIAQTSASGNGQTTSGTTTATLAPSPKPRPQSGEEAPIVITGSRIPRPNLTAVSPVTVLNSQEVKLQGATNSEDVLNQLPQVNPSQGEFASNGATGTATVDLRGLGASRTLVLINGRRLMPGDPGDPVPDINVVPASLIKRVEVLTGGAAAVYGSDAIAGVVNFILDTDLVGLRVDGTASFYQHDNDNALDRRLLEQAGISAPRGNTVDGGRQNIDLSYGRNFLGGRGHVTLYAGYRQIADLRQDTRDYSACTLGTARGDRNVVECGGSFTSFPANFFDNLGNAYQLGPDQTFVLGQNVYNFGPWNFYQRPDKRYTAGGFANVELSRAIKPYVEVMYMNDRSLAQIAPSGDFGTTQTINCDNPLLSAQQLSLICRAGNFVGEETGGPPEPFIDPVTGGTYYRGWLVIARRNVEGGPRQSDLRHKNIRLLGGVTGDVTPGITYDANYLFGRVTASQTNLNDLSTTRLLRSVDVVTDPASGQPVCRSVLTGEDPNCVPWDVFKEDGVTQAAVDYLDVPSTISGSYKQQLATAYVNVDLGQWHIFSPLADESPMLNAGTDFRKDVLDYEPDELAQSGDLAGNPIPFFPVHGSIETKEFFGEVRIPLINHHLIERLAFEGGFRRSWYTSGSNHFSADTYKLALDLTAIEGLRFRGSKQRAVRAPNLQELFTAPEADFFDRDPCAGAAPDATQAQCAATGLSAAQYGHVLPVTSAFFGYNSIDGGNPDLLPETATTRTLGVVLQPRFLRGFNATVDWWSIDLKGAVADIGAQTIIDTCVATGDPFFCSRIHRDPNGSLWLGGGYVDNRHANVAGFKLRGIDVEANYSRRIAHIGSLDANFRGSFVDKWIVDFGGLSEPFDCSGLYGAPCGNPQPRWRHTARLTWHSPTGANMSVNWRYIGAMKLAALDPKFNLTQFVSPLETSLPSQSYFDLTAGFDISQDLAVRIGVQNLFDREPPRILSTTPGSDGPINGNTYPQWYDPLGRYIFAGVTVNIPGI